MAPPHRALRLLSVHFDGAIVAPSGRRCQSLLLADASREGAIQHNLADALDLVVSLGLIRARVGDATHYYPLAHVSHLTMPDDA